MEPGLATYLLGIEEPHQVERDPLFGGLFENLVIVEAIKARLNRGKDPSLYFLRDAKGNEVDLVLDRCPGPLLVEIKSSTTFHGDFVKNLDTYSILEPQSSRAIVYGDSNELHSEPLQLVNYKQTSQLFT